MAIKHNQQLPNNHFRKDWQRRVRTHFDQPGKKVTRRLKRAAKAAAVAPRPVDKLRPIVRCPTVKYNRRVRLGRGFSLAELKAAGVPRLYAPTVGIAVDARRQNLSEESLAQNVQRLKEYLARLVVYPKKSNKPKKGDTAKADQPTETVSKIGSSFGFEAVASGFSEVKKSEMPKAQEGGAKEKRAKEKAEAETAKK